MLLAVGAITHTSAACWCCTEDVLKARLKTNGVVEHSFSLPKNSEFGGVEWKIYDVGGSRPQRRAWEPYFDDGGSSHRVAGPPHITDSCMCAQ